MKASQIKAKWVNVTKPYHKKQNREYIELRGTEINKCFGKVQYGDYNFTETGISQFGLVNLKCLCKQYKLKMPNINKINMP